MGLNVTLDGLICLFLTTFLIDSDVTLDELLYPKEVEDAFSLIEEFDNVNEISENEFLLTTLRHKTAEAFFRIDLMEDNRTQTVKELKTVCQGLRKMETLESSMTRSYISLMENKSNDSNESLNKSVCYRLTPFNWICRRQRIKHEPKCTVSKEVVSYGATEKLSAHNGYKAQFIYGEYQKLEHKDESNIHSQAVSNGFAQVFGKCNDNFRP